MQHHGKKIFLFLSLLISAGPVAFTQDRNVAAADLITEEYLFNSISFLTEDFCTGRASGSTGALEAASWVRRQFIDAGLSPMGKDYVQSFAIRKDAGATLATSPQTPHLQHHALPLDSVSFCLAVPQERPAAPKKFNFLFWKPQPQITPVDIHARQTNSTAKQFEPLPLDYEPQHDSSVEVRTIVCHNIMGFLQGKEDRYLIVAAHYDNLGVLAGRMYPGADSNASGVAVLTALAKALSLKAAQGNAYPMNILFVALDAKQHSMAGSEELWRSIENEELRNPVTGAPIGKNKVAMFVNLDILGATESPMHKDRLDYLIMLSTDDVKQTSLLRWCNRMNEIYLDLSFDYYGSKSFTDMFLRRVSDQKAFIEGKVPSVMFTSGITMTTNKTGDNVQSINFPILRKRALLVYHWIDKAIWQL